MKIELDFSKSIEENASAYFEKSKKSKKKLAGLMKAIEELQKKISNAEKAGSEKKQLVKKRKHAWFEAFHWFFSSNGFLVVAGRSAKQNEELVKKHLDEKDLFLHADVQGGAATIIKSESKKIPEKTIEEAAQFAAVFSKAWQQAISTVPVYAVSKEQVSKKAMSGEALATGGFMIYGKRQWFKPALKFSIGLKQEDDNIIVISGPPSALGQNCLEAIEIKQGSLKPGIAAKKIMKKFPEKLAQQIHLDEIIRMLPSSGIGL